jgi:hypothetical protein
MNEPDIELQELENLLGDLDIPVQDEFTKQTFDLGQTTDMLLEEIEDFDLYETRQEFVNGDLLRFFDNPSIPSNTERATMLDNLGESLWYDKWVHERCAQFAELEDLDMALIEKGLSNNTQLVAKTYMKDIFEKLEMTELPKKDALDVLAEFAEENSSLLQAGDAIEYNETFDVPEMSFGRSSSVNALEDLGIEMAEIVEQTVNLSAPIAQMETANEVESFFGIDETTARFSQTALDALDQVATTGSYGWDLWPTVEEVMGVGEGIAVGAAGALVMYGLVEGLTPIIKSLADTDWIRGGFSAETKESWAATQNIMEQSFLGPMFQVTQKIEKHLQDNPIYVWYLDNTNARLVIKNKKSWGHSLFWAFIKNTLCSQYWLRGRVIAMEGRKVGYTDSQFEFVLGIKITKTITDTTVSSQTYWVNAETAVILRDGAAVQHATNTKNLTKMIFNSWARYPLVTDRERTAIGNTEDQDLFTSLLKIGSSAAASGGIGGWASNTGFDNGVLPETPPPADDDFSSATLPPMPPLTRQTKLQISAATLDTVKDTVTIKDKVKDPVISPPGPAPIRDIFNATVAWPDSRRRLPSAYVPNVVVARAKQKPPEEKIKEKQPSDDNTTLMIIGLVIVVYFLREQ